MSEFNTNLPENENSEKPEVLEDEYIVEKILDKKRVNGLVKYKVKWEGYEDLADCTWEPKENLENVLYLIEDFDNSIRQKEKKLRDEKEKKLLNNKTNRNNISNKNNINSNSSLKDDDENSKSNNNTSVLSNGMQFKSQEDKRSNNGAGILHRQSKYLFLIFFNLFYFLRFF